MQRIYALLDIPRGIDALGRKVRGMSVGSSVFLLVILILLIFPLGYLYWNYDLLSTWNWTSYIGMRDSDTEAYRNAAANALDVGGAGLFASYLVFLFAMLPTFAELGLPRLIGRDLAALGIFLKISIAFDFFTDLPSIWNIVHTGTLQASGTRSAPWFSTWGIGYLALPLQGLAAMIITFIVSVVLQVVVILLAVAIFYLVINILISSYHGSMNDVTVTTGDGNRISYKQLNG